MTYLIEKESNRNMLGILLQGRMQWYITLMKTNLIRYKHGIVILIALLAPTLVGINYILTKPLLSIVQANVNSSISLNNIIFIYSIYILWTLVQRRAILPTQINTYLRTFPMSQYLNRSIDFIMLFISNNILLLPIALTLTNIIFSHGPYAMSIFRLLFLFLSILSFQLNVLKFSIQNILLTIIANIIFFYSANMELTFAVFLIQISSLLVLIISIVAKTEYSWFNRAVNAILKYSKFKHLNLFSKLPIAQLYSAILFRNARLTTMMRIMIIVAIIFLGIEVMSTSALNNHIIYSSYVILGTCVFVVSGLSVNLSRERNRYINYLNTLPCSKNYWVIQDIFFLSGVLLFINLIYNVLLLKAHLNYDIFSMLLLLLSQIPLLIVLYFAQVKWSVFGSLVSFLITIIWIFIRIFV